MHIAHIVNHIVFDLSEMMENRNLPSPSQNKSVQIAFPTAMFSWFEGILLKNGLNLLSLPPNISSAMYPENTRLTSVCSDQQRKLNLPEVRGFSKTEKNTPGVY